MTAYTTVVTTSDTSPFLRPPTATELLRRLFCAHPVGALLDVTVQRLAKQIGRSASRITPSLRQLEKRGYITRIVTPVGSLVEVLVSDQPPDRSCVPMDPPPPAEQAPGPAAPAMTSDPGADRSEAQNRSDPGGDRLAYKVDHVLNHDQQRHNARARESTTPDGASRPEGVYPGAWQKVQAANPGYTAADFARELALVQSRPSVPDEEAAVQLVVGVRKRGEAVYARQQPKEQAHGPRSADSGDRRSHGTQHGTGSNNRRGGARGGAQRGPYDRGEKRDKYGVGAAFRSGPTESDLPPFLRAAAERARLARQAAGGA